VVERVSVSQEWGESPTASATRQSHLFRRL